MDNLFSHPGFRLIYVGDNDTMSLVNPSEGGFKEDILENGYRCISHLWGDATKWDNHPVENIKWNVDLREDKRTKLLQIFSHFKGYWWVDVFCTNQEDTNKPLSIMGDVYKKCTECICMLDIRIPDFLKQPYRPRPNDDGMILGHALEVLGCEWNKRVWTFQEWYLPPKVCYTSETAEESFCVVDTDDFSSIIRRVWETKGAAFSTVGIKLAASTVAMTFNRTIGGQGATAIIIKSGRKCREPKDYYYGIASVFEICLTDGLSFLEVEKEFFRQLKSKDRFMYIKRVGSWNEEESIYNSWKHRGLGGRVIEWLYDGL